jgi:hypothetical protein
MTRTVTIMIVETYASTILVAGLPAHIDDPHPGVAEMGGEPGRAYERRAINRGHDDTSQWRALILAASKSNRKALFLLLLADAVEKVENQTTPKISQIVNFGLPRRCDAL